MRRHDHEKELRESEAKLKEETDRNANEFFRTLQTMADIQERQRIFDQQVERRQRIVKRLLIAGAICQGTAVIFYLLRFFLR